MQYISCKSIFEGRKILKPSFELDFAFNAPNDTIVPFILFQEKLRMVTVMGAGLLVGTALAVIIPEGVHTLYDAQNLHGEYLV